VLGDHESIRLKMIEDRKALLLELCGCQLLHDQNI
jgi:hypothetical protein